ncbi:hypothetical protein RJ55_06785 [Drechmeria coniospora]|nr:hypothetical protein RJ55_06785 [Drechmeria coniospora]
MGARRNGKRSGGKRMPTDEAATGTRHLARQHFAASRHESLCAAWSTPVRGPSAMASDGSVGHRSWHSCRTNGDGERRQRRPHVMALLSNKRRRRATAASATRHGSLVEQTATASDGSVGHTSWLSCRTNGDAVARGSCPSRLLESCGGRCSSASATRHGSLVEQTATPLLEARVPRVCLNLAADGAPQHRPHVMALLSNKRRRRATAASATRHGSLVEQTATASDGSVGHTSWLSSSATRHGSLVEQTATPLLEARVPRVCLNLAADGAPFLTFGASPSIVEGSRVGTTRVSTA